jgi:hypothetical protein
VLPVSDAACARVVCNEIMTAMVANKGTYRYLAVEFLVFIDALPFKDVYKAVFALHITELRQLKMYKTAHAERVYPEPVEGKHEA